MLDEQHSHVRDAMDSIRGKTVMDVEHFFYCIFFCWRRVSISFKSLIVFETRPISIKLLFVGHRYGMSKLALFDLRVFFFLWVSGSAYTFSGIFFSVNQILFTNKTNYFQSCSMAMCPWYNIQFSLVTSITSKCFKQKQRITFHIRLFVWFLQWLSLQCIQPRRCDFQENLIIYVHLWIVDRSIFDRNFPFYYSWLRSQLTTSFVLPSARLQCFCLRR